jgi:aminopeptidase N
MKRAAFSLHLILLLALMALARTSWSAPHLDLDIALDPARRTLTATASITTDTSPLNFFLAENFVVQSVELDGATIPTHQTMLEGLQQFQIDFPDAQQTGTVTVRYEGELQPLNTSITHEQTLQALPAMTSSEASFLPGESAWHPVLDTAFTFRLNVSVPEGQIAVAPGAPSNEQTANGLRRATFTMTRPVDRIDVMTGKWSIREREVALGDSTVRIRTYFDESGAALADGYLDAAARFIERYSTQIGNYPYGEFSVVSSPIPTGFGMPTLTYLGKQVLAYPFIRDISLGHEILHSWWGTGIRIDPVRGNWAEGLTTFMADYAFREDESAQAAMQMRHTWLRDYAALPPGSEKPLSAFRARYHTASATIGYGKSAMMFYALRNRLGNETFSRGIREFWKKYRYQAASFENLREAIEQVSEQSLDGFFNQWLERTGAPLLGVIPPPKGNKGQATLLLTQEADAPYELNVPLRLFAGDKTLDTRVHMNAPIEAVKFTAKPAITAAQIDPQFEVWRKLYPEEAPPVLRDFIAAASVQVLRIGKALKQDTSAMANALTEGDVVVIDPPERPDPGKPLLVFAGKDAIDGFLQDNALAARPAAIAPGAVEIWIAPDATRKVVVVTLDPGAAKQQDLLKLGQRLRHFGRYSWVSIAADGKATKGNWPITSPRFKLAR